MFTRADIRKEWDRIRPMLAECLRGHPERPEDIYAALRFNVMTLWVDADGSFVVLREVAVDDGSGSINLEVTCAARAPGAERGFARRCQPEVTKFARQIGARRLVLRTSKEGLDKALAPGWRVAHVELEFELGGTDG